MTVPESNDGVVVRQFDLAAALKRSGGQFSVLRRLLAGNPARRGGQGWPLSSSNRSVVRARAALSTEFWNRDLGLEHTASAAGEVRWKVSGECGYIRGPWSSR